MIEDLTTLYRDFLKSELQSLAEELEIDVSGETTTKVLVKKIINDIVESGVPETEDCSTLMLEFLVAAEVCDEDGNLLDEVQVEGDASIPEELPVTDEKMPDCYGFEDNRDPACNRCKAQIMCRELRMAQRPPCFGKLYEANDENCKACIEAPFCKLELSKNKL